jgi:toxin-antitoxin system PIN domain toxin
VILLDVNVLVYAFKEGAPQHVDYRSWLERQLAGPEPVGLADEVLSGVLRIVTHPRVFEVPSTSVEALAYVAALRDHPMTVALQPGARHWCIFTDLVVSASCRGNLVTDAYLAAIAIETGSEWITTDRDFARFEGLRWRHPLAA